MEEANFLNHEVVFCYFNQEETLDDENLNKTKLLIKNNWKIHSNFQSSIKPNKKCILNHKTKFIS